MCLIPSSLMVSPILILILLVHVCASATTIVYTLTDSALASNTPNISAQYTDDSTFQSAILDAHNFFRDEHNATALTWNDTSKTYAISWAEKCQFEHSGGPTGENLAAGYANVTAAVDAWANERVQYDFSKPDFSKSTGHFTQVVWKATVNVGCARKSCLGANGTPGYYIVCEYYPPGNVIGQFAGNVQSQIKGPKGGTVEQGLNTACSLSVPWKGMLAVFGGAVGIAMVLW